MATEEENERRSGWIDGLTMWAVQAMGEKWPLS